MEKHPQHSIIQDFKTRIHKFYDKNKSYMMRYYQIEGEKGYTDFLKNTVDMWVLQSYRCSLNKKGETLIEIIYWNEMWAYDKEKCVEEKVAKDLLKFRTSFNDVDLWAFITVGWNDQEVTPKTMLRASENIASLKYFKSVDYVLEKHRENGVHHHTHFLVKFHQREYTSKLLDWIHQTKGVKQICLARNCIDIKGPLNKKNPYQPLETYEGYIRGIKKEEKKKYIELDNKWRKDNNFLDIYEKNNL